jgi:hypothetical protein
MEPNFRVGQYVFEKPLGEGGMAEVWLARNVHIGNLAAIKFLNNDYAGKPERLAPLAWCVPVTGRASVSPEIEAVVMRCLAKNPEERGDGVPPSTTPEDGHRAAASAPTDGRGASRARNRGARAPSRHWKMPLPAWQARVASPARLSEPGRNGTLNRVIKNENLREVVGPDRSILFPGAER